MVPGAMDMCHGRSSSSLVQFVILGVGVDAIVDVDVTVVVASVVVSLRELSSSTSVDVVDVKEVVVV